MEFKVLDANGINIRTAVEGEGPLVLMVHGWPESWYSWRHQIPKIAEAGYTAAAIDVRGYGESDKPHEIDAYSLKNISNDVIGVIDTLGFEKAILVGHDWGAPIVHTTALLNEDRISAVAGLSVPYTPRGEMSQIELFKMVFEGKFFYILYFQKEGEAEEEFEKDLRKALELTYFSGDARGMLKRFENPEETLDKDPNSKFLEGAFEFDVYPEWISKEEMDYFVSQFEVSGMRGPINRYRALGIDFKDLKDFKDAKLKQPASFITGSLDPVNFFNGVGYKDADDIKSTIGGFYENLIDIQMIEGAGHWVQQEKPDEVNKYLLDFLNKVTQ